LILLPEPSAYEKLIDPSIKVEIDGSGLKVPPRNYQLEVYVDDNCTVCPLALALTGATEKALDSRLSVTVFNLSHMTVSVKVSATPAFCLRVVGGKGCVYWEGIPLDPSGWEKFFSEKLQKAYIQTHPYAPELIERVQSFAKANGYVVALDTQLRNKLLRELLENYDKYGKPYCPCRPEHSEATVCPCIFAKADIAKMGHCLCGLFWSKDFANRWLELSKKKNAKKLEAIDKLITVLQSLKDAVILNDRDAVEKTLDAIMALYSDLSSQ
jgi:ferredoxin-thioredoxin reductase catalytic subunit